MDQSVELREASCEPPNIDNCGNPFLRASSIGTNSLPCQVDVAMMVTICENEVFFEEVSVTPFVDGCILTQEDLDFAYQSFVQGFMQREVDVNPCGSEITHLSNYT